MNMTDNGSYLRNLTLASILDVQEFVVYDDGIEPPGLFPATIFGKPVVFDNPPLPKRDGPRPKWDRRTR